MLEVKNYSLTLSGSDGRKLPVLENVSFSLASGKCLGLAGESGSGKSVFALSLMGLLSGSSISSQTGNLVFDGIDLLSYKEVDFRKIRGKKMAMVFQEPMTAMNPLMTIYDQIAETVYAHHGKQASDVVAKQVKDALLNSGFSEPEKYYDSFPHQLSGGMRQRAMLAISLVLEPDLIIADEPTTALDASLQIQVLSELRKRVEKDKKSLIFISHDLGVIRAVSDELAILYAGNLLEIGPASLVLSEPSHPYTKDLIESLPRLTQEKRLPKPIPGTLPAPDQKPKGCVYSNRCQRVTEKCLKIVPELVDCGEGRFVKCFFPVGKLSEG